jgi:hypothetical protein
MYYVSESEPQLLGYKPCIESGGKMHNIGNMAQLWMEKIYKFTLSMALSFLHTIYWPYYFAHPCKGDS